VLTSVLGADPEPIVAGTYPELGFLST
jgi:hypothetical protein